MSELTNSRAQKHRLETIIASCCVTMPVPVYLYFVFVFSSHSIYTIYTIYTIYLHNYVSNTKIPRS
jgi:hypothetical protein